MHGNKIVLLLGIGVVCLSWPSMVPAQEPGIMALRLEQAVRLARENYPSIKAARAEAGATDGGVEIARNARLPGMEIDWQQTRGTRNNIFGQFFPQGAIPPISGPVIGHPSFSQSTWGSGGGLLVTWEPFDFGLRRAQLGLSERIRDEARARAAVTEFEAEVAAADAYLRVAAMEQAVIAARAGVERMETFARMVGALVASELRPGADASRTEVELAAARNVLIEARQQAALARVGLAQAVGLAGQTISIDAGGLLAQAPPAAIEGRAESGLHPLTIARRASLDILLARREVLDRSFFPKFNWQTAIFARGSGARLDGSLLDNRGYYPDTANWATGLTISFSLSNLFNLKARRHQEDGHIAAERAREEQTKQQLRTGEERARAMAEAAREYSENAPQQLAAAKETELRVRKRYEAELSTVAEVAEAQRLLAQAEVEAMLARIAGWRAQLAAASARGDLAPLLRLTGKEVAK